MAQYDYVAKDLSGQTVKGRDFAASEPEMVMRLSRKKLTIISIARVDETTVTAFVSHKRRSLKMFDLMVFCKQLATLVKGGVPLIRALEIMGSESKNHDLKSAITNVVSYIKQGESLSSAIDKLGGVFPPMAVAMIAAGEKVGALDVMLERLAKYIGARERINKKITSALAYPSVIIGFFFLAICAMTLFLIPRFKSIYASFGANLPAFTASVFSASDFFIHNIFYIAAIIVAVYFFIYRMLQTKNGRYMFDSAMLKMPIFGDVILKSSVTKFTRTLSTLMEQGISVPEALELVSRGVGNAVIEAACVSSAQAITSGEKMSEAFRKVGVFPPLVMQMVMVGTESGNLPELLDKTADFYEEQVDIFLTIMSSLIEPILIMALGAVLAVFILAMYMPIFKMSQSIAGG